MTALPTGLPMPRTPELLQAGASRVRVRTQQDRFPFPVPNGWFAVATSGEISPGEIRPLHYFGLDLVAFADDSGRVHLTEAYCPHLGAHLAVGGRVEGESIRCPFHGWRFDAGTGRCVEIPYATGERIPARARVRTFPSVERNGLVFAWHHLEGGEPFYDVPDVPEFSGDGWSAPAVRSFELATTCQEMAENNHDWAHFKFVHGSESIPDGTEHVEGTYKRVTNPGLERETFGLGLGVVRVPGVVTFLSSVTPIDTEHVHVRWVFTTPAGLDPAFLDKIADRFAKDLTQDVPIWENKVYRARPVLTKGERGIVEHRKWCEQFYSRQEVATP